MRTDVVEQSAPKPLPPAPEIELPESFGYRVKNKRPRSAARDRRARARAARHPDRARRLLVRLHLVVGVRDRGDPPRPDRGGRASPPFSLVVPITIAMLVVLFFLILSYRETIKEYPTAGGAYMVTRDNFGLLPAQVAGVSLLTDYILTVAVSVAAGTAALVSAFPARSVQRADLALLHRADRVRQPQGRARVGEDLRGPDLLLHRDHGRAARGRHRTSASPATSGTADRRSRACSSATRTSRGTRRRLLRRDARGVLHAFASVGTAVTGVEAISNGVTAFKKPEWMNARRTLVIMGACSARCSSACRSWPRRSHPVPYEDGLPDRHLAGRASRCSANGAGAASSTLLQVGHDADPRARGEHVVRRLPAARVVPRRRQLHAPAAHQARAPPGVLERHHLPRRSPPRS